MTLLKRFVADEIIVKRGELIEIPAEVTGLPLPKIEWSKDEVVIPQPTKTLLMKSETIHRMKANAKLSITETVRQDKGYYTITATNALGSAHHTIRVDVLGRFHS